MLYCNFAEGYEKLVNARKHGLPEGLGKETSEDMFDMFGDDEGKAADTPATTGNGSFSAQAVEGMLNPSILKYMV